jgi:hypothetical protein
MTSPERAENALRLLLAEPQPTAQRISALLDGFDHDERVAALRGLQGKQLRTLFDLVKGHAALGFDELVPRQQPNRVAVHHIGRNSLPVFTHFEKRFYRTAAGTVAGANFQTMSPFTGPGYFVACPSSSDAELVLDYDKLPDETPAGWPAVRANDSGISRLVYGHMLDTLRRVSKHVTIGAATRHGRDVVESYFTLCRRDASS